MPNEHSFSPDDLLVLSDREFFHKKYLISQKIKDNLERLQQRLQDELQPHSLLAPDGFDPQAVQFVKGEHLEHFPYQYLDFPRHYTRHSKLAFRSLFWWGHHVVFALIVEGPFVPHYRRNFFNRFSLVADRNLSLSLSPSLWEWKAGPGLTLEITHDRRSELAAVLERRTSFKIARYIPYQDQIFFTGEIIEEGVRTLRSLLPVITP